MRRNSSFSHSRSTSLNSTQSLQLDLDLLTWAWRRASSSCSRRPPRRRRPSGWWGSRCGTGCPAPRSCCLCRSPSRGCWWRSTRYARIWGDTHTWAHLDQSERRNQSRCSCMNPAVIPEISQTNCFKNADSCHVILNTRSDLCPDEKHLFPDVLPISKTSALVSELKQLACIFKHV